MSFSGNNNKRPRSPSAGGDADETSHDPQQEEPLIMSMFPQPLKQPNGADASGWSIQWTSNNQEHQAVITANPVAEEDNTTTSVVVVLQGRGMVENISSNSSEHDCSVEIHGHQLLNKQQRQDEEKRQHDNGNHNIDDDDDDDDGAMPLLYYFESASWSSCWTTVHMSRGSRIRVTSITSTTLDGAIATDNTSTKMCSFAVHAVQDPEARPTVIPLSWKTAVDKIVDDYCHKKLHRQAAQQQQRHHKHASFFQQTTLETSDDDDEEEDRRHHQQQNNKKGGLFCVVVAGAKGVGKSTCLRYCLNRLLPHTSSAGGRVAVLDADPGQPEYTVPGMLQLTVVSQPALQLQPPSHRRHLMARIQNDNNNSYKIIQSHYFGSVTPSTDPEKYIQCVSELMDCCCSSSEDFDENASIPVLVNLHGWVKGLGFEILTALLSNVVTTTTSHHVIQIAGDSLSKSLDLTPIVGCCGNNDGNTTTTTTDDDDVYLHQCWAYNSVQERKAAFNNNNNNNNNNRVENGNGCSAVQQQDENQQQQHQLLLRSSSEYSGIVPLTPSIPAAALRSVRLISYFVNAAVIGKEVPTLWDRVGVGWNGIDDPACEIAHLLAAAKPYVVSMDAVLVRFTSDDLQRDIRSEASILDALNGSVVGLCTQENDEDDEADSSSLPVPAVLLPCLGLGIVRAIDRAKRLFFLLTPCSADELQSVNVLTLGSNVHLPLECYFRGVHSDLFPYQSFDAREMDILGATPMKSRNNISRARGGGGSN